MHQRAARTDVDNGSIIVTFHRRQRRLEGAQFAHPREYHIASARQIGRLGTQFILDGSYHQYPATVKRSSSHIKTLFVTKVEY